MTDSLSFEGGKVKATIPNALYLAIVRLQGAESLDWASACSLAAERIDANTQAFGKAVEREVLSRHRSKLLTELNKGRKTIEGEAYERAKKRFEVWYLCSVCEERVEILPGSNSHKAIIEHMKQAGWGHKACYDKSG
jgi:hypothetical protein